MTLEELKPFCERYGYEAYDLFGEVHVKTKYERWFFKPGDEYVRLMHKDKLGDRWHEQFRQKITPEDLATYLHEHEVAKYIGRIDCSITKDGRRKEDAK